jgi:MFS family permease
MSQRQILLAMALAWCVGATPGSVIFGFVTTWLHRIGGRWPVVAVAALALAFPIVLCLAFAASSPIVALFGISAGMLVMGGIRGPIFATVQDVIPSNLHATATAIMMFFMYAIGVTFGPLLTGIASDALAPRFGSEALRYGLFIVILSAGAGGSLLLAAAGALLSPKKSAANDRSWPA